MDKDNDNTLKVTIVPFSDKDELNTHTINVAEIKKTFTYIIKEPDFSTLSTGFSLSIKMDGNLDMINAGKFIWDTCCIKYDKRLDSLTTGQFNKILLSICLRLYDDYLIPFETDIKKK